MSSCPHCPAIFGNEDTLIKHITAIHSAATPESSEPAASSAAGKPEASGTSSQEEGGDEGGDENHLEVAPLLSVLTHEQKDLLLLRAIAQDNSLAYHVLAAVLKPLTPEVATARLAELDAAGIASTVHAYLEAGAGRNALAILRASTIATADSLNALGSLLSRGRSGWEESDELDEVERLPAAAALGSLWAEALAAGGTEEGTPVSECVTDEDEGLLMLLADSGAQVRFVSAFTREFVCLSEDCALLKALNTPSIAPPVCCNRQCVSYMVSPDPECCHSTYTIGSGTGNIVKRPPEPFAEPRPILHHPSHLSQIRAVQPALLLARLHIMYKYIHIHLVL